MGVSSRGKTKNKQRARTPPTVREEDVGRDRSENLRYEQRTEESKTNDVFEIMKRVPIFSGEKNEDVEEWLWKVGFVFEKHGRRQAELIKALH